MLADLKARIALERDDVRARMHVRFGDMRARAAEAQRFPLVICPFNTALHLYTRPDVERFLARVRAHLAPRRQARRRPRRPLVPRPHARPRARLTAAPHFRHPTTGDLVRYCERFDYDCIRQVLFVTTEFEPVGRPDDGWVLPLAHRQFFPQEWEALLHYNGFVAEDVFGDFHGGPLTRTSDVMVWHARKA